MMQNNEPRETKKMSDGWLFTLKQDPKDRSKMVIYEINIVLCKNCKYYNTAGCAEGFGWCDRRNFGTYDEWYCADGEMREDELINSDKRLEEFIQQLKSQKKGGQLINELLYWRLPAK